MGDRFDLREVSRSSYGVNLVSVIPGTLGWYYNISSVGLGQCVISG